MRNIIHFKIIPSITNLWVGNIKGRENIPKEKIGFIVAANHASYLDHFIVGSAIIKSTKRILYFLAKKEHFEGIIQRKWHEFLPAIPIDREKGGKKALRIATKELKKGKIIMIYPEGTRTLTGKIQRGRTGVAKLALAAKVPVLPIGLIGTFKILPKGKWIPLFKRADANIGKLMYFDEYYKKKTNKNTVRIVTTKIMKEIAKLTGEKYNFN